MPDAKLFQKIVSESQEGVYFVDCGRQITFWNHGAESISGYLAEDVIGSRCSDNILQHVDESGQPLCVDRCPLAMAMQDSHECDSQQIYLHHRAGHRIPVSVRIMPIKDEEGQIIGAAEIFNERRIFESDAATVVELKKAALYDQLTSLPNRRYLEMALNSAFEELRRGKLAFGVIMADIDFFKRINDTFGHDSGDAVLKMVASTLDHNRRTYDLTGRWGGEEFVILLKHVDNEQLVAIAEKLRTMVAASFLTNDEQLLQVTITMGVTMAKSDDTINSLMKRADVLLYEGKSTGRNRVVAG